MSPSSINNDNHNPSFSQTSPQHDGHQPDDPKMAPAIRRTRPSRSAASKASAKITAAVHRENSAEVPDGPAGDLLSEAMTPLEQHQGDQSQWKAWVEIESEPAFFNGLLKGLGVEDVKVVEVFTVDPDDLDTLMLPQPVLGFVFLSKYVPENHENVTEPPADLWFANQTMANGCATLALLNILMNKPDVHLGSDLTVFKATTAPLAPPLRGWLLDENPVLRQKHNAYARCLEHLNADLFLSNENEDCGGWPDEDAKTKTSATTSATKKRARKPSSTNNTSRKRRRAAPEDACHYKAFVFSGGQVWVLDGLEDRPASLGPATPENWMLVALGAIQAKVQDAAGADDMRVNVLAVCRAPTAALRTELRANVRALSRLRASLPLDTRPPRGDGRLYLDADDDDDGYRLDDAALEPYGLVLAQLRDEADDGDETSAPPPLAAAAAADAGGDEAARRAAVAALEMEQARIQSEYRQEVGQTAREEERCSGRKKDYGQVVHRWVRKIAERGSLQGLLG